MLGVTMFLTIVVAGNMVGAAAYDHIGAMGLVERPTTACKVFGLVLVILGVGIVARS